MSEQVQIALITTVAAFIGAIAGAAGTVIVARINVKNKNNQLLFETRLRFYSVYISAVTEYLKHYDQADTYADMLTAVRNMRLVCTPELSPLVESMSELLFDANPGCAPSENFKEEYRKLILQMNRDMDIIKPLSKSRRRRLS